MAVREGSVARANARMQADLRLAGEEIRRARVSGGLSQAAVGRRAGISGQEVGRLELGRVAEPPPRVLARVAAVVGLDLRLRAYPGGSPIRDAGHVRLLLRYRRRLHAGWAWHIEVPVDPLDHRWWDAVASKDGVAIACEAETRLHDIQAQARRAHAKFTAGTVDRLVLVVADTDHNRRVLRDAREVLRGNLPLDTRATMAALAIGRDPGANGIVVL